MNTKTEARPLSSSIDRVQVGDIIPIHFRRERIIVTLAQREGWRCHYCHHPLSRFYSLCIDLEYHAERWHTAMSGDQHPGWYPVYQSFLLEGCKAIHLDHKLPVAKGGTNGIDNRVLSCPDCNLAKSHRYSYDEFMAMTEVLRR